MSTKKEATKRRNNNEIVAINYDMICDRRERESGQGTGGRAGQGGSLGTAETHLMRLTLVDVKSAWVGTLRKCVHSVYVGGGS